MKWHKKNHSSDLVLDRDNHIQRIKHILKQNGLNLNLSLNLQSWIQLMVWTHISILVKNIQCGPFVLWIITYTSFMEFERAILPSQTQHTMMTLEFPFIGKPCWKSSSCLRYWKCSWNLQVYWIVSKVFL